MKAKRKPARRFLVGHKAAEWTTVFGKRSFCKLLTKAEASRHETQMCGDSAVFELVPVDLNKAKE